MLVVAHSDNPLLFHFFAFCGPRPGRKTIVRFWLAAACNQLTDIYGNVTAENDVVSTRTKSVTSADDDLVVARVAHDLHAARHSPTVDIAVVQPVLRDNVVVQPIEICFG